MQKFYVKRNETGAVVGLARWPFDDEPIERLDEDHSDVLGFLSEVEIATTSLSAAQFYAMLAAIDIDAEDIQQVISARSEDPIEREFMRQKLDRQQSFMRRDKLVSALLEKSGRDENEINDLWLRCSQME